MLKNFATFLRYWTAAAVCLMILRPSRWCYACFVICGSADKTIRPSNTLWFKSGSSARLKWSRFSQALTQRRLMLFTLFNSATSRL